MRLNRARFIAFNGGKDRDHNVDHVRGGPSSLPLTVGGIGIVVLSLNRIGDGHEPTGQLAMGLILFSITLAIGGRKD